MISEEYYVATREKMRGTCLSLIAGFIIGAFVGYLLFILMNSDPSTKEKILYIFFFGLVFSGAPYVWKNFSYVSLSIKGIIIQGLVSVLAGWLVTPIMLL